MRRTLFIVFALVALLISRSSAQDWWEKTPVTNEEIEQWSRFFESRIIGRFEYPGVMVVTEDWMFAGGISDQTDIHILRDLYRENLVPAFDRDDPIPLRMMLYDLHLPGKKPPPVVSTKPVITIKPENRGTPISFEADILNVDWSGGPGSYYKDGVAPWMAMISIDIASNCAKLPDGKYFVEIEWKGEGDRPTLKSFSTFFILASVTIEQVREFVQVTGEENEIVKLKLGPDDRATLTNGSARPIAFYAEKFDNEDGGVKFHPAFQAELFKANGWVEADVGWCGSEDRKVVLQPGEKVELESVRPGRGAYDSGKEIWRATISWQFADDANGFNSFKAHSDFILIDSKR